MIYFDLPELPRTVTADNGPGSTRNAPKQNEKRHNRYHDDVAFFAAPIAIQLDTKPL